MANLTCANLLQVDHIRVLRLDSAGAVDEVAGARYEYDSPILFGYTPVQPDRDSFEQRSGNGSICATFTGPAKPANTADLTLNLCHLDAELIEMLVGGTVITTGTAGSGDSIGWLAPTDATVNENGVAIETWSKAWNGTQRLTYAGQAGWFRHFFPLTTWQLGETSMSNDGFSIIQLTGVASPNSDFGTGWTGDALPLAVGDSAYGYVLDDAIPDGNCGVLSAA